MQFYTANIFNLNYLICRKSWMNWLKDSSVSTQKASWLDVSGHWMDCYYLFVPVQGKMLVMFDSSLVVTIKGWGLM
jgi:hypothetical protein